MLTRGVRLLLTLLALRGGNAGEEAGALAGVVVPVEDDLVVDELAALRRGQLPAKVLRLQQVEKVQTHRVLDELGVLRSLPVLQVVEVVDERLVLEVAALGEVWAG